MTDQIRTKDSRLWPTLLLFLAVIALALGCKSSASSDPTGGETHWLQLCSASEACDEGQCLCGVCSQPCDEGAECAEGESCEPSDVLGCSPDDVPVALCLPKCTSDTCGPSASCRDGLCVPTNVSQSQPIGQPDDGSADTADAAATGASITPSADAAAVEDDAMTLGASAEEAVDADAPTAMTSDDDASVGVGDALDGGLPASAEAASMPPGPATDASAVGACSSADCSESCQAQDIQFMLPCLEDAPGHAFNGSTCVSGCGCEGTDCDQQFESRQECVDAYVSCLLSCESVPSETPECLACASQSCASGDPMIEVSEGCCLCQSSIGINPNAVGCVNAQSNGTVTIDLGVLEEGYEMVGGCEANSFYILDEYGRAVWPTPRGSCAEDIESIISIEPTSIVWDGWSSREFFASPGRYTAVVCANSPEPAFNCASVAFDYPADERVDLPFPTPQGVSPAHFSCVETSWPCLVGSQWCDGTCRVLPEQCREDPCGCFEVGSIYRSWPDGDTLVEECRVDELGGVHVTAALPEP